METRTIEPPYSPAAVGLTYCCIGCATLTKLSWADEAIPDIGCVACTGDTCKHCVGGHCSDWQGYSCGCNCEIFGPAIVCPYYWTCQVPP